MVKAEASLNADCEAQIAGVQSIVRRCTRARGVSYRAKPLVEAGLRWNVPARLFGVEEASAWAVSGWLCEARLRCLRLRTVTLTQVCGPC